METTIKDAYESGVLGIPSDLSHGKQWMHAYRRARFDMSCFKHENSSMTRVIEKIRQTLCRSDIAYVYLTQHLKVKIKSTDRHMPPCSTFVGVYTRGCRSVDIREDLRQSMFELTEGDM